MAKKPHHYDHLAAFLGILAQPAVRVAVDSGALAITSSHHSVDGESDSADTLVTITGASADGQLLLIRQDDSAGAAILVQHGTGANQIVCPGAQDIQLAAANDYVLLVYQGARWVVLAYNTLASGGGGLGALLASTSNGEGAALVGVEDAAGYYAGGTVEAVLTAIGVQLGGDTDTTFDFTEANVLADDDAVFAALEKLDLKWGDLGSTANTEGAALVGIEDAGGYFTGADVEAALAELGTSKRRIATGTIPAGDGAGTVGDLNSTPVSLVAAPGAGLFIEVHSIHWFLDYGTAAYDGLKSGNLMAKYTNGSGDEVVGQVAETGFMDQTADTHAVTQAVDCVPVENAAIVAHADNDWYAAAGDSPVKYRVDYSVRSLDPTA